MIKRNMSFLITNQFFTVLAESLFHLALLWYVYQLSNSATYTSFITAVIFLTNILSGPFIGVIVDRHSPKSLMQLGYGVMIGIGIVLFSSHLFWNDLLLFFIYSSLILHTVCMHLIEPAKLKLLPRIVGQERIVQTNGLISSTSQIGSLIGQALSGVFIGALGFAGVMIMHSATYLLASLLLLFVLNLPSKSSEKATQEVSASTTQSNYWFEFKEGVKLLMQNKQLLKLAFFLMALNTSTIAGSMLVVLVADHYGASAVQFGLMNACGALVGIVIGLFAKNIINIVKVPVLLTSMFSFCGIAFFGMGLTTNYVIGVMFFVFLTISTVISNITIKSLFILLVADAYRGRFLSLITLLSAFLMPPLAILGGILADTFAVHYLFLFTGLWIILIALFPVLDRDLRKLKQLSAYST